MGNPIAEDKEGENSNRHNSTADDIVTYSQFIEDLPEVEMGKRAYYTKR